MKKREFLRTLSLGTLGLASGHLLFESCSGKRNKYKNWAWMHPRRYRSDQDWLAVFAKLKAHHIDAALLYGDKKEDVVPKSSFAQREGVELHHWIRSLECTDEQIMQEHPDWFSVSRNGESSLEKPPYIEQYKWLCPTNPAVREYMVNRVTDLAKSEGLTGVHMDYIRYPDVILPIGLQPKYNLVQDKEYPEFDFCYCSVCRESFKNQEGIDPLDLPDPASSDAWKKFRYDSLTELVNQCCQAVRQQGKLISAAVFPSPDIARTIVRQDWPKWDMDALLPMMYHKHYNEGLDWIKKVTQEGKQELPAHITLHSGLNIRMIEPGELPLAVESALQGDADGIVLFTAGTMSDEHWKELKRVLTKHKEENHEEERIYPYSESWNHRIGFQ